MSSTIEAPLEAPVSAKRRAILDAAGALFLDQGFAAVSMDAVARAADVSKATLYAHFDGKEALFTAIIGARCAALRAEAEALQPHDAPLPEALARIGGLFLRFLLREDALAMFRLIAAEGGRMPALADAFAEAGPQATRRWLSRWLAEEQAMGRLRPDAEPEEAAASFAALVRGDLHGHAVLHLGRPAEAAQARAVATAVRVFLAAYGARAGGMDDPTAGHAP